MQPGRWHSSIQCPSHGGCGPLLALLLGPRRRPRRGPGRRASPPRGSREAAEKCFHREENPLVRGKKGPRVEGKVAGGRQESIHFPAGVFPALGVWHGGKGRAVPRGRLRRRPGRAGARPSYTRRTVTHRRRTPRRWNARGSVNGAWGSQGMGENDSNIHLQIMQQIHFMT